MAVVACLLDALLSRLLLLLFDDVVPVAAPPFGLDREKGNRHLPEVALLSSTLLASMLAVRGLARPAANPSTRGGGERDRGCFTASSSTEVAPVEGEECDHELLSRSSPSVDGPRRLGDSWPSPTTGEPVETLKLMAGLEGGTSSTSC